MKKMTRKDATNLFGLTVNVGYCGLRHLVSDGLQYGHNMGVYGWNWDCYRIWNNDMTRCVNVISGYRNLVGYDLPTEMIERYNRASYLLRKTKPDGRPDDLFDSFVNEVYEYILGDSFEF